MSSPDRSAPGPAAGFHFQVQRSLVLLLGAGPGSEASIETLDDVVVDEASGGTTYHQLKHSIRPGTLSDASGPFWKALDAWMDVTATPGTDDVVFRLVATHEAASGTAAAALRASGPRDVIEAERLLLIVADTAPDPPPADASALLKARVRFKRLPTDRRRTLLARISVHDGDGDIGDLRQKLTEALGPSSLPRTGGELFLNQIMGWWEEVAAAMLLGRRTTVTHDEAIDHIRMVRDTFTEDRLPDLDPDLLADLNDSVVTAYRKATFVRQLELLVLLDERVQQAITDYHRAYVQRSRWVKQSILTPSELEVWEDALVDEWERAFLAMVDELASHLSPTQRAEAGKHFFGSVQRSSEVSFRDGRHPVLRVGTMHGLADASRVGWHPDFKDLLNDVLVLSAGAATSSVYHESGGSAA